MSNEPTDDELFLELQDTNDVPLQFQPYIDVVEDRNISNQRLTKCLNCPFMKNLKCTQNWNLVNVLARSKNASCPIGEW